MHVVSPGSSIEGKFYDWLKGPRHFGLLPEVPAQAIAMIREDMQRVVVPKAIPLSSTAGTNRRPDVKNPRKFAMRIQSIQGQGGSKRLVRCATLLRDCGWAPDAIYSFMVSEWNLQAVPPWSEAEIARVIARHCK